MESTSKVINDLTEASRELFKLGVSNISNFGKYDSINEKIEQAITHLRELKTTKN